MSSWYLLSLKIESELLYPRFCVSRGKMWMAPFIASQPPLYLFLLLQHATKKDRLWSCSASQLPQESKLSCLRKKKKKKEEEEEEKKANTLIIQSWGGAWSVNANQLLSEEIREKKIFETTQEGSVIFSAASPIFLWIHGALYYTFTHAHGRQLAGTKRGDDEEEGGESQGRDRERLRESWCHPFGYVCPGVAAFQGVCVCVRVCSVIRDVNVLLCQPNPPQPGPSRLEHITTQWHNLFVRTPHTAIIPL